MKNDFELDLLIVGQGLAGSAVALRALASGYRIFVVDEPSENVSSAVAAGLFNPVTGRKMVKTWLADDIFPSLHRFYREAERLTGGRFLFSRPIYRTFLSIEEQNEWIAKSADHAYRDYVTQVSPHPGFGEKVNDPFGGITLKQCGYLDTRGYLDSVRNYLKGKGAYAAERFHAGQLEVGRNSVRYRGLRAKKVVFCQGVGNVSNPWFGHLPIRPLKGEFLTVQCLWENSVILNRGVYMVPGHSPGEWRVGATFNRGDQHREVTSRAREDLSRKLEDLIRIPYTVTGQQWGFRPTTPDRRPMLGAHPEHESLIIFNGLGTKGVSLAPYFSEVLIRWMDEKGTINEEADVSRFN